MRLLLVSFTFLLLLPLAMTNAAVAGSSSECTAGWVEVGPPAGPTPLPRFTMAMGYHESSKTNVVFGGTNGTSGAHHYGDTWGWDGSTWGVFPVGGPLERYLPAMAYHGGTDALVLFGGFNADFVPPNEYLSDTWTWDPNGWSAPTIVGPSPQRRGYHAMAYDAFADRVVLYGGASDDAGILADTWLWDGSGWSEPNFAGPTPGFRQGHVMAYDAAAGQVLLFGGWDGTTLLGDTWGWDGASWQQLATSGPSARQLLGLVYDESREVVVLFGGNESASAVGSANLNDTWEWDGSAWTERTDLAGSPSPRDRQGMSYDGDRSTVVLFGGRLDPFVADDETWELQTCSISQQCPCDRPVGGTAWKNHGAYVSCVAHAAKDQVAAGTITGREKGAIVSAAARSTCGFKPTSTAGRKKK